MEKESKIGTKFSLVDLIVLASYYLFCLFLFLSLTGLFKKEFIILGLVVGFLFLLAARKKIEWEKHYLYFFILIPALFAGVLLIKGTFNGDGIGYWLPWAREIVLQERMPDFLFNTTSWVTSRMPFLPLFYAGIFGLFGFADWVMAVLPFFFAAATVFLMYRWLLEKGVKKTYLIFGVLLLLANPLFLHLGGEVAQETFILFFFTAFFYYLEKSQRTNSQFYFLLAFLSAVLAAVSKETGLVLLLPLGWFFVKNNQFIKKPYYFFLTFPLLLWLFRNYLIYDNPLFPALSGIFRGQYYNLAITANQIFQSFSPPFWNNILARVVEMPVFLFLLFCPAVIMSFYGFWKERKFQYILLFFIFLLSILLVTASSEYIRFLMPFLAVFIVYAVIGLEAIKSRVFLSFIFFLNLWGLFFSKLSLSQSQFLSPAEAALGSLRDVSQFIYDYRLFLALALALFFFFLLSRRRETAKYLILLLISTYLVKTASFNLGSWLNIWLPILGLIFIVLIWQWLIKLKEETLRKLVISYIIVLLVFSSWGLSGAYFLAHKKFVFPNFAEAYGAQPEVAYEIEKLEGENKDFYIYAVTSAYFTWYHNLKTVVSRDYTFHVITNLEWEENLNPSEIHSLFKRSNIKYVMDNIYRPQFKPFFDKIKNRPDLFEPIFKKEGVSLWRVI